MDERAISSALDRLSAARQPTLEIVHGPNNGDVDRLGLLPGSFDPMTVAHAALAEALHRIGCDLVVLLYSARTLAKEEHAGRIPSPALLRPDVRVASLVAFARPRPWAGVALTSHGLLVDQVEAAATTIAARDVVVGMGSDKLLQVLDPRWYRDRDAALARLFGAARVAYAVRAGDADAVDRALAAEPRWRDRITPVALPADVASVSSRGIRDRHGRDAERWIPPDVARFLKGATREGGRAER